MGLNLSHNIDDVISDVEDVKTDIPSNLRRWLEIAMQSVLQTAITHVANDSLWKGNLIKSIRGHGVKLEHTDDGFKLTVGTDSSIAPYAPFIEFGTGKRGRGSTPSSTSVDTLPPHSYPQGYPFKSPSNPTEDMIDEITEWVKTKPIISDDAATPEELGIKIAHTIVERGTYAHPFLRPAYYKNQYQIKQAAKKAIKEST